jgi:hypothetical protein
MSMANKTPPPNRLTKANTALGPLEVSKVNPRYFTVASRYTAEERAVYLTGSHVNNNFHDGAGPEKDCAEIPEKFDFPAYLTWLKERGHNFIRLWRWELFKSQVAGGHFHICASPQPWMRSGASPAKDGKPKFDLSQFDEAYFNRLREYAIAAGNEGIYVSVMFFEGFSLTVSNRPDNLEGHPFFVANNVNGIGITSVVDYQVLPLDPDIQALQEAYIRKVVDTVQDLPNVLYEVANESPGGGTVDENFAKLLGLSEIPDWGDTTQWQYWVINFVKGYEEKMGYTKHPIGMTMQFPVADQTKVNEPLFNSPADWISPGFDDDIFTDGRNPMAPGSPPSRWFDDPPAANGRKVILSDTDHYSSMTSNTLWAWKSFLRGHNPILYDLGIIGGVNPPDPTLGSPSYESHEATRYALGDTLRYAKRMKLIDMEPRGELSSTGYVLANPGVEYLVLEPSETAEPFTVTLPAGTYKVEWFSVNSRKTKTAEEFTVKRKGSRKFIAPFTEAGPSVVYLMQVGR